MAESSYQLRAHRQLHKPRFLRRWDKKQGWYQTVSSGSPSAEGKGSRWVGSERGSTDRPSEPPWAFLLLTQQLPQEKQGGLQRLARYSWDLLPPGDMENMQICFCAVKGLNFPSTTCRWYTSRALHYPSFSRLLGLKSTLLNFCCFLKLNEEIPPKTHWFGSKWLWGDEGELTHCLLQCLFLASKRHRDANLIFFSVLHDFALVVNYLGEIIISTLGKTRHNVSVLAELVLSMSKT